MQINWFNVVTIVISLISLSAAGVDYYSNEIKKISENRKDIAENRNNIIDLKQQSANKNDVIYLSQRVDRIQIEMHNSEEKNNKSLIRIHDLINSRMDRLEAQILNQNKKI
jgi:hypothetical protein